MPLSFQDLQNGFYNAMAQGLGFAPQDNFQLVQPAIPLVPGPQADSNLWSYFNDIPPLSLTHDYVASGGDQFFSNYRALFSALEGQSDTFQHELGPNIARSWKAQMRALPANVQIKQLPQIFRQWATTKGVQAVAGKSATLQSLVGDPITAAQLALMLYLGDSTSNPPVPNRPADWSKGYADLLNALRQAAPRSLAVSPNAWNVDVSHSWTGGRTAAPARFLRDNRLPLAALTNIAATFASTGVHVSAEFNNVLRFSPRPGGWYDGEAFGIAFNQRGSPPWDPSATIKWTDVFDPDNGSLARFVNSLVVVNRMDIVVTSDAPLSPGDRSIFHNNSGQNVWPFYANSVGNATTGVAFDASGRITITTTSQPGVPIILGCTVTPVAKFVEL